MKTKFQQNQLWKIFFSILFIALLHFGLCRPPTSNVDPASALPNPDRPSGKVHQPQVRPAYDLRDLVGTSDGILSSSGGMGKNNGTLLLLSEKDFLDLLSEADVNLIGDIDDAFDDDAPTRWGDVTADKEGSVPRHQVADRNLVRKRRQPEQHRPHRRRRRKHRLVLKARDRNHLSDGGEGLKDRRGRFLIKSDSPGYLITSASEVKKDWCRTIPLKQKVTEPNCRSRVVQNNFCYGQCNSFFIPHPGRTDNKVAFQSCAFCKPFKQHWGNVTLNCPGRNPPKIEKTVLFVDTCRCITEVFQ